MLQTTTTLAAEPGSVEPLVLDVRDSTVSSLHPVPSTACAPSRVLAVPMEQLRARVEEVRTVAAGRPIVIVCAQVRGAWGDIGYFRCCIVPGDVWEESDCCCG